MRDASPLLPNEVIVRSSGGDDGPAIRAAIDAEGDVISGAVALTGPDGQIAYQATVARQPGSYGVPFPPSPATPPPTPSRLRPVFTSVCRVLATRTSTVCN